MSHETEHSVPPWNMQKRATNVRKRISGHSKAQRPGMIRAPLYLRGESVLAVNGCTEHRVGALLPLGRRPLQIASPVQTV